MLNSAEGSAPWTSVEVMVTAPEAGVAGTRPRLETETRYDLRSARAFAESTRSGPEPDGSGRSVAVSSSSLAVANGVGSGVETILDGRVVCTATIRSQPASVATSVAVARRTNNGKRRRSEWRGRIGLRGKAVGAPRIARAAFRSSAASAAARVRSGRCRKRQRPARQRLVPTSLGSGDRPEEPMGLVVGSGREEQRARRSRAGAVAEADPPKAVDRDRPMVDALDHAVCLPAFVRAPFECVNPAVAEIADEEVAAELAEGRGSLGQTPRSVEIAERGDAAVERPV